LADIPKDNYDFGLQRWMKKRGKFYRPNLSANELREYQDAFRIIDLDGSGTLEVDELVQAMRALDQPVTVHEITKLMELIAPGKGYLNETDFIELVHYRSLSDTTKPNVKLETEKNSAEEKPKHQQVSMGILAGTFRRKKALDLLMLPWEIRNNSTQEALRQSELSQILTSKMNLEPLDSPNIVHKYDNYDVHCVCRE
jgi:Fe2+ transport system protein FeoA